MRIQATDTGTIPLKHSELPHPAHRAGAPARAVTPGAGPAPAHAEEGGGSFTELLAKALRTVNSLQQEADLATARVATGEAEDLHEAVIAMEKADLALRLTAQVTQRAIEAYKEISRMQL